jgi:hypothetical protein
LYAEFHDPRLADPTDPVRTVFPEASITLYLDAETWPAVMR